MPTVNRNSAWDQWYRRALPAYWIFLFCATHFPRLELDIPIRAPDKVAHWTAFGLLTFLFWRFAETLHRPVSRRFVWKAGLALLAYAAVDEYLQQFVGRSTDLTDWVCNGAGIITVLAWLEWRRRVTAGKGRAP
jgi:VanZ family protein